MSSTRMFSNRRSSASFIPPPPSKLTELNIEAFLNKYRSLVSPEEFVRFHNLASKTRPSRCYRCFISSKAGRLEYEYGHNALTNPQRSQDADLSKMEIILVEDVDVWLLVALEATYQLDPQFLLAYTGTGDKYSPDFEATTDPTDMAGKWYTTEISMSLEHQWEVEDSDMVKMLTYVGRPWYKSLHVRLDDTETEAAMPWWKEAIRTDGGLTRTTVRSKIACYCLTDKLRELNWMFESPAVSRR